MLCLGVLEDCVGVHAGTDVLFERDTAREPVVGFVLVSLEGRDDEQRESNEEDRTSSRIMGGRGSDTATWPLTVYAHGGRLSRRLSVSLFGSVRMVFLLQIKHRVF